MGDTKSWQFYWDNGYRQMNGILFFCFARSNEHQNMTHETYSNCAIKGSNDKVSELWLLMIETRAFKSKVSQEGGKAQLPAISLPKYLPSIRGSRRTYTVSIGPSFCLRTVLCHTWLGWRGGRVMSAGSNGRASIHRKRKEEWERASVSSTCD